LLLPLLKGRIPNQIYVFVVCLNVYTHTAHHPLSIFLIFLCSSRFIVLFFRSFPDLLVPRAQIIDTVDLFHIKGQRKISLKYLAWHLLGIDIQLDTHCSVEDARTALALYKIYVKSQKEGTFNSLLNEIYTVGRSLHWKTTAGGSRPTLTTHIDS
jgi:hypothetical protein